MKTFELYELSSDIKAIKQGISFPAFFFTWIWALIKCQWLAAILLIIITFLLSFLLTEATMSPGHTHLISISSLLIMHLLCGGYGNKWLAHTLQKKGYHLIGTVRARNKLSAIQKHNAHP